MARIQPDRAALEIAYNNLPIAKPLDAALKDPILKRIIENRARIHMRQRDRFDLKKMQANDND
ncbi:hypothetical protein QN372_00700 [Undibacterium sp. RTI2.1]|uniref:hypothetical protein n=1 Tax=unclassified Undibacterium TaxID=2630295 RepID=UPI002AB3FCE1|nr:MULTISPECIES: hypothetical protein [unclassified Undibacterium]MDY7537655.1 hypothetical protein [Undibacterium sp. 5I1]MEB0029257.1 hypothetical protein [Undibacterium sp. RTI2.1]MEB0115565.1 hypothetical protein [Undibacterium sp. RTI2.2]MEB0256392.1 hypothetical protein [Undibacterium sp. 5I1]